MKADLNKIINLMDKYHPLSVYLYGSYAYGKPHKDSDLDLFIVTKNKSDDTYQKIMGELWNFNIPIELVVYDQKTIQERLTWNHLIQHIVNKGKLIYGQAIK